MSVLIAQLPLLIQSNGNLLLLLCLCPTHSRISLAPFGFPRNLQQQLLALSRNCRSVDTRDTAVHTLTETHWISTVKFLLCSYFRFVSWFLLYFSMLAEILPIAMKWSNAIVRAEMLLFYTVSWIRICFSPRLLWPTENFWFGWLFFICHLADHGTRIFTFFFNKTTCLQFLSRL